MYCRICGKQIPDNSAFCSNCGTAQAGSSASAATPTSAAPTPAAPMSAADSIPTPAVPASPAPAPAASAPPEPPSWYTPQPFAEFGAAAPAVKPATRKKNTSALIFAAIAVLLAAALVLSFLGILPSPFGISAASSPAASSPATAPKGFDTPEDAINNFVASLKAGDFEGALSASAMVNVSSRYDYRKYVQHVQSIPPFGTSDLPSDYPQFIAYNKYKFSLYMLTKMIIFSSTLNLTGDNVDFLDGTQRVLQSNEQLEGFIEELNPAKIDSLEIVEIAATNRQNDEKTQEIMKMQAGPYGAEDMQGRSVLYQYNGNYYTGGFMLLQYDGKWQVYDMYDPTSDLNMTIVLAPLPDKSMFQDVLSN